MIIVISLNSSNIIINSYKFHKLTLKIKFSRLIKSQKYNIVLFISSITIYCELFYIILIQICIGLINL